MNQINPFLHEPLLALVSYRSNRKVTRTVAEMLLENAAPGRKHSSWEEVPGFEAPFTRAQLCAIPHLCTGHLLSPGKLDNHTRRRRLCWKAWPCLLLRSTVRERHIFQGSEGPAKRRISIKKPLACSVGRCRPCSAGHS